MYVFKFTYFLFLSKIVTLAVFVSSLKVMGGQVGRG